MRIHRHQTPPRGVVLLLILALMAMFGMVVFAFVIISRQEQRSAKSAQRVDEQATYPEAELKQAALQVFRGSRSPRSRLQRVSLLEDMYGASVSVVEGDMVHGNPHILPWLDPADLPDFTCVGTPPAMSLIGYVGPVCPTLPAMPLDGQLIAFTPAVRSHLYAPCAGTPGPTRAPAVYEYKDLQDAHLYVGRVLTMRNGVAAGQSTRIVGYDSVNNLLHILPFENVPTAAFVADVRNMNPQASYRRYIINGAPFSGTGVGYLNPPSPPTNPLLGALFTGSTLPINLPYALLPNLAGGPGAANEDYDAPDYQNPLMAMVLADGTVPIPSLHRPALVNYWFHRLETYLTDPAGLALTQEQAWLAILQPWGADGLEQGPPPDPPAWLGRTGDDWPWLDAAVAASIADLKRMIIFRPAREDHPGFAASNIGAKSIPPDVGLDLLVQVFDPDGTPVLDSTDAPVWVVNRYWERGDFGQWDVDNDGSGTPDSIWVDAGFPVRQTADGRLYKPMVAILCVDQDGKLNLNAHGTAVHLAADYTDEFDISSDSPWMFAGPTMSAGDRDIARMQVGQGYGPAEISLLPMFEDIVQRSMGGSIPPDEVTDRARVLYRNVLLGMNLPAADVLLDGRYGEANRSQHLTDWISDPTSVTVNLPAPGVTSSVADPLSHNKHSTYPDYPGDLQAILSSSSLLGCPYRTPADFKGWMMLGADFRGAPYYPGITLPGTAGADVNHPYELDLWRTRSYGLPTPAWVDSSGVPQFAVDNPYTVAEFERLLRPFDVDVALLPNRLQEHLTSRSVPGITISLSTVLAQRYKVTTESWDLPTPPVLSVAGGPHTHLAQLLQDRGITEAQLRVLVRDLLSVESRAGMRMDLNRLFGNGLDDNLVAGPGGDPPLLPFNGVVDEPQEALRSRPLLAFADQVSVNETLDQVDRLGVAIADVPCDHDNDGYPGSLSDPRLLYARHLYVLAMALTEGGASPAAYPHWEPDSTDGLFPVTCTAPSAGNWTQADAGARWLAQWAVNVVDFRDSDSIMTRFAYDPDPFDTSGWSPPSGDDFVVWGCERPELLITETVAFHDRRTEDREDATYDPEDGAVTPPSDTLSNGSPLDSTFDQRLKPQGSLFIELYNPWVNHESGDGFREPPPGEFYYDRSAGTWLTGIDLTAEAPDNTPVWRIIVVLRENTPPDPGGNARTLYYPEMDPDYPGPIPSMELPPTEIDRAIYFTDETKLFPAKGAANVEHFPCADYRDVSGFGVIDPGGYAVIGPGEPYDDDDDPTVGTTIYAADTHIGLATVPPATAESGTRLGAYEQDDFDRRIILDLSPSASPRVDVLKNGPTQIIPGDIRNDKVVPIPINYPQRLSVSEPPGGYPDYTDLADGEYEPPRDMPLDKDLQLDRWNNTLTTDGTHVTFAVIHLQRLANPLINYDPATNPYRTVDSMPVDLTVFNGVPSRNPGVDEPGIDITSLETRFSARERGEWAYAEAVLNQRRDPVNLWRHEPVHRLPSGAWHPPRVSLTGAGEVNLEQNFQTNLQHTFSFLNAQFSQTIARRTGPLTPPLEVDQGYPGYVFPMLTWNNRPFVSQMELMMVPAPSSSQLLGMYDIGSADAEPPLPPLPPALPTAPFDPETYTASRDPYPHLMNFFYTHADPAAVPPDVPPAHLYRLLDYVHVPSRFVGTETQANPQTASEPPLPAAPPPPWPLAVQLNHAHHPPHNGIARYREPGRVNLNTVFSEDVFRGLMNDAAGFSADWADRPTFWRRHFIESRRAYPAVPPWYVDDLDVQLAAAYEGTKLVDPDDRYADYGTELTPAQLMTRMDPRYPTLFGNPFRSFAGYDLIPPTLAAPDDLRTLMDFGAVGGDFGVNSTLLRCDPHIDERTPPDTDTDPLVRPLFAFDGSTTYFPIDPSDAAYLQQRDRQRFDDDLDGDASDYYGGPYGYNDHDRNPFFRYQALQRLGNLVTTRSNVYATWITMGYFEVRRHPQRYHPDGAGGWIEWSDEDYRSIYPQGFELGPELGSDTGEVKRHRAFYIFDRTIPVGFQRGRDTNVEDAILLERFIE